MENIGFSLIVLFLGYFVWIGIKHKDINQTIPNEDPKLPAGDWVEDLFMWIKIIVGILGVVFIMGLWTRWE